MAMPILVVASYAFHPGNEVWAHLAETVLQDYVLNSLALAAGVAAGTLVIGVGTAWLTVMCDFPLRRTLSWLLLLPMAVPAYIIAYTYTGMLEFAGPVQETLRAWTGWEYGDYWFPPVRSLGGAIVMLTLVLYPYVYLLTRAAFIEQCVCVLDVGRTLGLRPFAVFRRIALPLARPAVVTGLSLVLMETLADYGAVKYFGVSTFTTGIFRTWFGLGDQAAAAQLSAVLLGVIFSLILLERWSRRQRQYHHTGHAYQALPSYPLHGGRAVCACLACLLPVVFGFVLPAWQLLAWSLQTGAEQIDDRFPQLIWNTVSLAGITALLAVGLALVLGYGRRLRRGRFVRAAVRIASLGYAVPGTVIAVGVIIPFAWLDNSIDNLSRAYWGVSTGLILSGTVVALVFAYLVRFLAVSLQTVEAGLANVSTTIDDTARSLGASPWHVMGRVHVPLLRGSLLTAGLLVFVDVLKELPATLILRPFDFNTLAVRTFELASDEQLAAAAPAALAIAVAGIGPVILLSRSIGQSRPGQRPDA
jgi:iron(III) transport system permease protein